MSNHMLYLPQSYRFSFFSLLCALILIGCPAELRAEKDSLKLINNIRLGVRGQFGAIYPHHTSIQYVVEENIAGAELSLSTDAYGRNEWSQLYRYPRYGLGFLHTSLGNQEVHGRASALFIAVDIPFSAQVRRFRASYQFGLGLAHVSKIFDVTENPLNFAMSTPINVFVSARLNASYQIYKSGELYLGFCLGHYSNGRLGTPNRGLNTVALQLGLRTNIRSPRYERMTTVSSPFIRTQRLDILVSGGIKTDDILSGKHYMIASLVGDYNFQLSRKYAVGGGLDLFYDAALGPNLEARLDRLSTRSDLYQMGLHAGATVRISNLRILVNVGRYLYANFTKYSRFYGRLGLRYDISSSVFLNLSIKSHYAIADFVEWGVGYRIPLMKGTKR